VQKAVYKFAGATAKSHNDFDIKLLLQLCAVGEFYFRTTL
jgi:hypothetical protein